MMIECSDNPNPPTSSYPSSSTTTSTTSTTTTSTNSRKEIQQTTTNLWNICNYNSKCFFNGCIIIILLIIGSFQNYKGIESYQSRYQIIQRLNYDYDDINNNTITKNFTIIQYKNNHNEELSTVTKTNEIVFESSSSLLPPVCKPFSITENRKIKRIFVYHMRKAGGTTILRYFRQVAMAYNLTFEKEEGGIAEDPSYRQRNDTFYITFMRDPIERTISHYKYDFRWNCKDLMRNTSFIPTIENSKSIQQFLTVDIHRRRQSQCEDKRMVWLCSANCYTRWFALPYGMCENQPLTKNNNNNNNNSNNNNSNNNNNIGIKLYSIAYKKMKQYDLIIDSNRLFTDKTYVWSITNFFQIPGLLGSHRNAWCSKPAKQANEQNPLILNNQTLQYIRHRNQFDYQLYNEFIVPCHNTTIQFPTIPFPMYTHNH